MSNYQKPNNTLWTGRKSNDQLYLHEKIECIDIENNELEKQDRKCFALFGYTCDEGVRRNHGRIGAKDGPDAIRKMLGAISNHTTDHTRVLDIGNIECKNQDLETTQQETALIITSLLQQHIFPLVLGGGHDLAYSHYNGIKNAFPDQSIGIINFDAHFDLRKPIKQGTSGTPFYQIAKENNHFEYLCLGIQKFANNKILYDTAQKLKVEYLDNTEFTTTNLKKVSSTIKNFISKVDLIYLTIDLDGFSSAYAPGVSAPSSFGFDTHIALHAIDQICSSQKLISADIVEYNPLYDIDNCTSRLAARIIYTMIDKLSFLST